MTLIDLVDHALSIVAIQQITPLARALSTYRLGRQAISAVAPEVVPAVVDSVARLAAAEPTGGASQAASTSPLDGGNRRWQ